MKFLLCTSLENEDNGDEDHYPNGNATNVKKRKESKIRLWYDSMKNLFNGDKKNRVEISEPVPLSKDIVSQVTGVVEVRPQEIEENIDKKTDNKEFLSSEDNIENASNKANVETNTETDESNVKSITINDEIGDLHHSDEILNYGWFWGDISRRDAENLLRGQKEGTFLVRKSSDKRFLYSLSFRSNGKTLHTRIEYSNGLFYFFSNDSSSKQEMDGSFSLADLISDAMNQNNAENIFFYSRGFKTNKASLHTITLVKPLSRFQHVINYNYTGDDKHKSLQYLCKFVIHHSSISQTKLASNRHLLSEELKKFLNEILLFPCTYDKKVQQQQKSK